MFIGTAGNYALNTRQGASFNAKPAALATPTGTLEPGVVIRSLGKVHGVLPAADALRLATEIADALEAHRTAA